MPRHTTSPATLAPTPNMQAAAVLLGVTPSALQERLTAADRVLSVVEVAQQLGIGKRTAIRLIDAGHLPRVRLSARRVGVLQSDLASFLAARREG